MDDDDRIAPDADQVEVLVGWNSSSPKAKYLFSESSDNGTPSRNQETPRHAALPHIVDGRKRNGQLGGVLGKYANLMPGSSPPRHGGNIRKRRASSPVKGKENTRESSEPLEIMPLESLPPAPPNAEFLRPNSAGMHPPHKSLRVTDTAAATAALESASLPRQTTPIPDLFSSDSDIEDLMILPQVKFPKSYFNSRKVRRYVVQQVQRVHDGSLKLECTDSANKTSMIWLKGSWSMTDVRRGDTLHLQSLKPTTTLEVSDSSDVYAVVNPDIMIPCTSVAEMMSCERQVVLRTQVRPPSALNANLVLGSLRHEFLQICFSNNIVDNIAEMEVIIQTVAEGAKLDLHLVDLDVPTAVTKLKPLAGELKKWAKTIWGDHSSGRTVPLHRGNQSYEVKIRRPVQIEEEIRSTFWGLVGKVDVTVEACDFRGGGTSRLVGLEIKTGKNTQSISHRAQTSLYNILLAERHPNNTHSWSLLYYTETGATYAVETLGPELRSLIQKRNALAYKMWKLPVGTLPNPTATSDAVCNWCSVQNSCVLYTAAVDNGDAHGVSALGSLYRQALEHQKLGSRYLEFVAHWMRLLELEYETAQRYQNLQHRQWWLTEPDPILYSATLDESRGGSYIYTMTPNMSQNGASQRVIDIVSPVRSGDRVILSTRQQMGTSFGSCILSEPGVVRLSLPEKILASGRYRIDADPWFSEGHNGLARFNLSSLMEQDRLRELIVDLVAPRFATLSSRKILSTAEWASNRVLSSSNISSRANASGTVTGLREPSKLSLEDLLSSDDEDGNANPLSESAHSNLNEDQTSALNKVLSAQDYALILGMPGTGKTTTIVAIVASLVRRGKSVLVSGYTNSAVDTIVLKLLAARVECLRLTSHSVDMVHPDVRPVTATSRNVEEFKFDAFMDSPVIACTSHSTSNKLFSLRQFDYCIVDEASQITLPFCLGPLRLAPIFVLVGDHYQLPPVVKNAEARELGLSESLFKILCDAQPHAVVELSKQYRMSEDIMSLSSELVYGNRLVCGSEVVGKQKLALPKLAAISPSDSLYAAVLPENRVVFLDTDPLGEAAYERSHKGGTSNPGEACMIAELTNKFEAAGMDMRDVAIISVYRQQLSLLTERLAPSVKKGLEVLTADQAQGRDKGAILVSLVRSNPDLRTGELLKDWRRLNVAFTRAKKKLVIIGSRRMMQHADGVARFFQYIEKRNWVYKASPREA